MISKSHSRSLFGVLAVCLLAAILAASPAAAEPPNVASVEVDDAAPFDEISWYAEAFDVTLQEAKLRLKRQETIANKIEKITATEDDRVAGWGIDHEPELRGFVLLTGDAPATSRSRRIAEQAGDIELRYGMTHSIVELEAAQATIEAADFKTYGELQYTDIDIQGNHIVLAMNTASMPDGQKMPSAAAARSLNPDVGEVPLHFVDVGDARVRRTDATIFRGGEGFGNNCTGAFIGQNKTTGKRGLITAGHCAYVAPILPVWRGVTFQLEHSAWGPRSDLAFYVPTTNGNYSFRGDIWNGYTYKDIRGTMSRSKALGTAACAVKGLNSGTNSCGVLNSIWVNPTGIEGICGHDLPNGNPAPCNPVWMSFVYGQPGSSGSLCPGDSGGPLSVSRKAIGVTSASFWYGGQFNCNDQTMISAFFSSVQYTHDMNVKVSTN